MLLFYVIHQSVMGSGGSNTKQNHPDKFNIYYKDKLFILGADEVEDLDCFFQCLSKTLK